MADEKTTTQETSESTSTTKDEGKLLTPAEKYKNYEADRKRLDQEHGNA